METNSDFNNSSSSERYRCANVRRFPVGGDSELVYFNDRRSAHIVPSDVAAVLDGCRMFQLLDDHVRQISSQLRLSQERIPTIRKLLSDFVQTGMLVSQREALGKCLNNRDAGARARLEKSTHIRSVGFVTRNRPSQLQRALVSYVRNIKQYGRSNDFVVVDGSDSNETRKQNRHLLRTVREEHGVEIRYAGLEEKTRYSKLLAEVSGVSSDVIDFALFDVESCGTSTGANRNALLLDTAGDLFFCADDDTVCSIARPFEPKDELAFWSETDPTEFWFFASREAALRSAQFVETDLLGAHDELLGATLSSVISRFSERSTRLYQTCAHLMHSLANGAGRVRVTFNGLVGDSGMGSPVGLLSGIQGDSRERFVRSHDDYRNAMSSREVLRTTLSTSIYHGTHCMATTLGLDNRSLLPPFIPVQRNQDGVFGLTLNICFEDTFFAHLPHAVLHAAEERFYSPNITDQVSGLAFTDILYYCMVAHQFTPGISREEDRLRSLGRYLMELGGIPLPEFVETVRLQLWQRMSMKLVALEQILKTYREQPHYWAEDLKRTMGVLRDALPKDDYLVARDLSTGRTDVEVQELTQRLIRRFGQLIYHWPEVVGAAKRLRAEGIRVAEAI